MLIIIVVLAVMAAVAIPIIASNGIADLRTSWAVNDIKAMIIYAQRHAIQTQVRTRVTFNSGSTNDMRLHRETTPDTNTWTYIQNPKDGGNFIVKFGSEAFTDVSITARSIGGPPTQSVIFDRYGTPYDRGTVGDGPSDPDPPELLSITGTVELNGASGWEIRITPETGHIQVVDI